LVNVTKLERISAQGEGFFYSLSFDIDDFIGDGIWWLQIYNDNQDLIHDEPFASSISRIDEQKIVETIKDNFLTY